MSIFLLPIFSPGGCLKYLCSPLFAVRTMGCSGSSLPSHNACHRATPSSVGLCRSASLTSQSFCLSGKPTSASGLACHHVEICCWSVVAVLGQEGTSGLLSCLQGKTAKPSRA